MMVEEARLVARITLAIDEDGHWEGMYVNGRLRSQCHSIDVMTALRTVKDANVFVGALERIIVDGAWLHELGYFPTDEDEMRKHVVTR